MKRFIFLGMTLAGIASQIQAAQLIPVPDIAPVAEGYHVVINIPQQRLFLYQNGSLKKVYPVGVGKAMTQTNLGEHKIGAKAFNPTWHIPLSIQRERNDGVKSIPPGPNNPLGPVFVRLGAPKLGLGIHGTSNPRSVPGVVSHGCVRMKSEQALEFAKTVTTGTPATVSYELAALNQDGAGNLWLAVFKDPYNKKSLKINQLKQSIAAWGAENNHQISVTKIDQIIKARAGKPICLTCKGTGKMVGDLVSVAWNGGSAKLTEPKGANASVRPAVQDDVLPEGSEIEVDADASGDENTNVQTTAKAIELPQFKGTSVFNDNDVSDTANIQTTQFNSDPVLEETPLNPIH